VKPTPSELTDRYQVRSSASYDHVSQGDGLTEVRFLDFETGETRFMTELPGDSIGSWFLSPSVSPDGRSIVYGQIDHLSADLMLVENFR